MTAAADAIVIGSGFGGAMAARQLVSAGRSVVMVERGEWVPRGPRNWDHDGTVAASPFYSEESPYRFGGRAIGSIWCVGGPSVFYGGVSLRMRERDFDGWPFAYEDLEPYYGEAEELLGVAGEAGTDPTEPFHGRPFPRRAAPLSPAAVRIAEAACSLGLRPFRLPMAIRYQVPGERSGCTGCATCDSYACARGAKNDMASCVLPDLVGRGMTLLDRTIATRIHTERGRVAAVEVVDRLTAKRTWLAARVVVLAAGALATPHLLLASGLEQDNPAGAMVGKNLMRHCNGIVYGLFPTRPTRGVPFHKQIGIHDFYFGEQGGALQQLASPPVGLVAPMVPRPLRPLVPGGVAYASGFLTIAEDRPRADNGVRVDPSVVDRFGSPQLVIEHRYDDAELAAREALARRARAILTVAGAYAFREHAIDTFSHALGTVRMGDDPETCPLDRECRFRGVEGLYVADASCFSRSAAVNPSLTIAANALRVGARIACRLAEAA